MTKYAPYDGTLIRVQADAVPKLRRMLVHLRKWRDLPRSACMTEYAGGYVALNVCRADAERLVTACGWTVCDAD